VEPAIILSFVSACTALVASVAGPFVTLFVAKQQFSANVLSANRQKWIETLRDTLAEFISFLVAALVIKVNWKEDWQQGRSVLAASPALLAEFERMVLSQCKIRLLINPTERDHVQLYERIDTAIRRIRTEESTDEETERDIEEITLLAQVILKREWQRVKRGI
jgi:triphosphoribosyl-dephospho-CoA synthetase